MQSAELGLKVALTPRGRLCHQSLRQIQGLWDPRAGKVCVQRGKARGSGVPHRALQRLVAH